MSGSLRWSVLLAVSLVCLLPNGAVRAEMIGPGATSVGLDYRVIGTVYGTQFPGTSWAYVVQNKRDLIELEQRIGNPTVLNQIRALLPTSVAIVTMVPTAACESDVLSFHGISVNVQRGLRTINVLATLNVVPPTPPPTAKPGQPPVVVACIPEGGSTGQVAIVPRPEVHGTIRRWTLRVHFQPRQSSSAAQDHLFVGPVYPHSRVTFDLTDQTTKPRIHFIYVLPADAPDDQLDLNGSIRQAITGLENWTRFSTGGRIFRIDRYNDLPDVTFVRLQETSQELLDAAKTSAATAPDNLKDATAFASVYGNVFNDLNHLGFAQEQRNRVNLALLGDIGGLGSYCTRHGRKQQPIRSRPGRRLYVANILAHEILHTLGFVPSCAPHESGYHVTDSSEDVMAPTAGWILDVGHDDYYKTGRTTAPTSTTAPT